MKEGATEDQIQHVVDRLEKAGLGAHLSRGQFKTIIGVIGEREAIADLPLEAMPGVENVIPILKPYKFVSRDFQTEDTITFKTGVTKKQISCVCLSHLRKSFSPIRLNHGIQVLVAGKSQTRITLYHQQVIFIGKHTIEILPLFYLFY